MKTMIILVFSIAAICSCSSKDSSTAGQCNSAYAGTYTGTGNTLTLGTDCTYAFSNVNCSDSGVYASPLAASGVAVISVTAGTGNAGLGGCAVPPQTANCAYVSSGTGSGTTLSFNCGGGVLNFVKQ